MLIVLHFIDMVVALLTVNSYRIFMVGLW